MLVDERPLTAGLLVRLEAKPGRQHEMARLLQDGLALVLDEPATNAWFAIRLDPRTFGIFDAFGEADGEKACVAGRLAAALGLFGSDLLARPPSVEPIDGVVTRRAQ